MICAFDLTADGSAANANYLSPIEIGTLRIQLDYSKPLENSATVFCMTESEAVLTLDEDRKTSWTN